MVEPTRRLALALLGGGALAACATSRAAAPDSRLAWDFSFPALEGGTLDFAAYRGRVLLVTNTASFCGYTYQYEALEALHARRSPEGLTVIGVPSQDFFQESDSDAKVKQFCEATFDVQFPMAGISHVRDEHAAPFYAWVRARRDWQPTWNFNKVLVGRDGEIAGTYRADVEPGGPVLTAALAAALARPAA